MLIGGEEGGDLESFEAFSSRESFLLQLQICTLYKPRLNRLVGRGEGVI